MCRRRNADSCNGIPKCGGYDPLNVGNVCKLLRYVTISGMAKCMLTSAFSTSSDQIFTHDTILALLLLMD